MECNGGNDLISREHGKRLTGGIVSNEVSVLEKKSDLSYYCDYL